MVVCLLLTSSANADAFLDTIRKEVNAVELDPGSQRTAASDKTPAARTAPENSVESDMPTDLSRSAFDAYLEQNYRGSFSFYHRLTDGQRSEVYQAYGKQPQIRFIRDKIKQTYLNP